MGACSSNDELTGFEQGNATEESGQKLALALEQGGMTAGTRALTRATTPGDPGAINSTGRPFYSIMADQNIHNIMLYFVSRTDGETKNKLMLVKHVTPNMWAESTVYSNGREMTLTLKKGEKLPAGTYDIYAVGYSGTAAPYGYTIAPADAGVEINNTAVESGNWSSIGEMYDENFYAVINSSTSIKDAEEIFAGKLASVTATGEALVPNGYSDNKTDESQADGYNDATKSVPTLVLYRQVAGITGYFTNLPAKYGETVPTHLRLVASNKSDKVFFNVLDVNATDDTDITTNYVVNGGQSTTITKDAHFYGSAATPADAYIIYEIDLSKWFVGAKDDFSKADKNGDGYVGYEDVAAWETSNPEGDYNSFWTNPNRDLNDRNQGLVKGSVWGGKFVIPFKLASGKQTLQLQLLRKDADGTEHILTYWNVNVDKANLSGSTAGTDISTGTIATNLYDESKSVYNIYRNHTYSIGEKMFNDGNEDDTDDPDPDPEDPTDPDDPDDDDKPSDLSKGQDLVIRVNSNWEANHSMELD